uniref:Uncharacterized protein n=1 Tax=Nelumbo nucifera TaxID=4432 RepID=A0A822YZB9_NELNU|nr:TPA_asm: hypothetical protein HUJ06_006736 [Nelumbo nucifera]
MYHQSRGNRSSLASYIRKKKKFCELKNQQGALELTERSPPPKANGSTPKLHVPIALRLFVVHYFFFYAC